MRATVTEGSPSVCRSARYGWAHAWQTMSTSRNRTRIAAERWPTGTFIVRLQAANGDHWERFVALTVVPIPGA